MGQGAGRQGRQGRQGAFLRGEKEKGERGKERIITNAQLPITHYPLPITHYPLPITHCPLPIAHYPLPITHCPLPHAPCPMPNAPCPITNSSFSAFGTFSVVSRLFPRQQILFRHLVVPVQLRMLFGYF